MPTSSIPVENLLTPSVNLGPGAVETIDFTELLQRSIGLDIDRVGIPGVQDKVSARMITVPLRETGSAGATHILKLNPPEYPHLVENEAFFAAAAATAELTVAQIQLIHDRNGEPGLLVKRFDREATPTGIQRLAQEDACQVLGRYPADKYLMTTEDVAIGLSRHCAAPQVATSTLLAYFAFAYLSCNGDAHAKNFSILRRKGEWRISPAYDLPSSYPYRDKSMALSLNRKNTERLGLNDFLAFAALVSLREKPARQIIADIADSADAWIEGVGAYRSTSAEIMT